jgi:ABC-type branched-subunit amino acid transport system substrate-binding protein
MINKKRLLSTAAACTAAVAVAGCASSGSSPSAASSGGTYNWGIDAELSGPISYYGLSITAGVQAYVNSVNASGGIDGHKIKLTKLDNAGDSSQSSASATQLVTADNVDAIFGQTLSSDCLAAQPIDDRYQVPIACFSVAEKNPYVFNLGYDASRAGGAMLQSALKVASKPHPVAALLYPNTATVIDMAKGIEAGASAAGVKIASSQEYSLTATNLSIQVARVVAAKPDVVLISATGPALVSVLKGIRAAGLKVPVVWSDGTGNISFLAAIKDTGLYALNDYEYIPASGATGAAANFIMAMGSKLGSNPSAPTINGGQAVDGYITAAAFGQALKSCGYPCSGAQLTNALDKAHLSMPGLEPSFGYSAHDHYPYPNWYLYQVDGPTARLADTYTVTRSG